MHVHSEPNQGLGIYHQYSAELVSEEGNISTNSYCWRENVLLENDH